MNVGGAFVYVCEKDLWTPTTALKWSCSVLILDIKENE